MKNTVNKLLITLSAGSFMVMGSCTKKIDDSYWNPNAQVKQPIETLLPNVIDNMVTAYTANGTGYGPQNDGIYIGRFIQNWATSSAGNQYDQMGDNFIGTAPDVMGSIWAGTYYGQGQNLNKIILWGTEEKKWDYVGVAQAIRAWAWTTTTDIHDQIILKEAFNSNQLTFHYDPQEEVYAEAKRLCFEALNNLSKTGDGVSQANLAKGDAFMNGGDVNKWKKFTYGLLARLHNRYTNKSGLYQPDSVIYYANLAMQTNADNTSFTFDPAGGGYGTYSYWSPFRGNIGSLRQTKFIADLMSGRDSAFLSGAVDPRAPYIIRENPNGTYKGGRPNKGADGLPTADQPSNFWGGVFTSSSQPSNDAGCRYIFTNKPKFPIMTASEMQFLKAEAYIRKGDKTNALAAYKSGILLNFEQLRTDYETNVPTALRMSDAQRDAYMNNSINVPVSSSLTRSHIMLQKYIALYGWGVCETWVDIRRHHYTDLDPETGKQVYRDLNPPTGTDLYTRNNGKWIYRHRARYNSEYLYNIDELNKYGGFASDYITKECWFSIPQ
jgi:hypothetical protein